MPYLSLPSRRSFFARSVGAAALLQGAHVLHGQQGADPKVARWALLSDTHVSADRAFTNRGFRPAEQLTKVAGMVANAKVSAALINGDLALQQGLPEDYQLLTELLQPMTSKLPVALGMGNHDHRKNFQTAFQKYPGDVQVVKDKHVTAIESGPVRFLVLDSLIQANVTPGLVGKEQRAWLERYLASSDDTPTIVFVHHTPGDGDIELMDAERVLRILKASRKVKALMFGHSHRYRFDKIDGFHLINIPAVGYNFQDEEPTGWLEAEFTAEGANFKLHAIGGNTEGNGKTTSVSWRG